MAGRRGRAIAAVAAVGLHGCSGSGTFAQHAGFRAWFDAHPRAPHPPTAAERALLDHYRPVLYTTPRHPGPIDFYRDYVGHGTLTADGRSWSRVDRARLAAHADDPGATFRHQPPRQRDSSAVAYGRIDRGALAGVGELTFLTWHFVFRHSGLPLHLPAWLEAVAAVAGDRDDWHQLDHYTAATLVLGPGREPLALILQQHNWRRAYWFGRDLPAPPDGRVRIAAALRSNELYPRPAAPERHRVVRFLEAGNVRWLAAGAADAPWLASHDRVRPGTRVGYALQFLPQTDPFYRFRGRLGAERMLPGRDGPPGADFNTLPAFKDRVLQLCALRWSGRADTARLAALERLLADPRDTGAREHLLAGCRAFARRRLGR